MMVIPSRRLLRWGALVAASSLAVVAFPGAWLPL